jgi:hypothetical protein
MKLGLDFDNTLVTYDRLFHRVACEEGLIEASVAVNKNAVRDDLRRRGLEPSWTALQGRVYGPRMKDAELFPGVIEALAALHTAGVELCIVSHKTRHPYSGEKHDLHLAARSWIEASGLCDVPRTGLSADAVFFELTKEAKLARIRQQGCTHFIDDLPEILNHADFPAEVRKILFDPSGALELPGARRIAAWEELSPGFLKEGIAP